MINLLPDETKRQIRAARMNSKLLSYLMLLIIAVIFLAIATAASAYLLSDMKSNNEVNSSETTPYSLATAKADTIKNSLSTADSVLNQQLSYSKIITGIASRLPSGTTLESLSLSNSAIGVPMTIQIYSKSSENETLLKNNFQDLGYELKSNTPNPDKTSKYPFIISISITINRGLYI